MLETELIVEGVNKSNYQSEPPLQSLIHVTIYWMTVLHKEVLQDLLRSLRVSEYAHLTRPLNSTHAAQFTIRVAFPPRYTETKLRLVPPYTDLEANRRK
jgi:hypothetical protein